MDPNILYEKLDIEKDLVTGFSILFSRFEYALKRTARYAQGDDRCVQADWDRFARDHASAFDPEKSAELQHAVTYLRSNPPKKQILQKGVLDWKAVDEQNTSLLGQIVYAVKRVRNNLFHGGKFPMCPMEEPGRNRELLESCVTILGELLCLNEQVKTHFEQGLRWGQTWFSVFEANSDSACLIRRR